MDKRKLTQLVLTRVATVSSDARPGSEITLIAIGEADPTKRGETLWSTVHDAIMNATPEVLDDWDVYERGSGNSYRIVLERLWPYQILTRNLRNAGARKALMHQR